MKKLIASMLFILGLAASLSRPASAQNANITGHWCYNYGAPCLNIADPSYYNGEIYRYGSEAWALGYSTGTSTLGAAVLTWDDLGHIGFGNGISSPTITSGSGGTNPVITPGSSDISGGFAPDVGAAQISLNWSNAYNASPFPLIGYTTGHLTLGTSYFTLTGGLVAGVTYYYFVPARSGR
jgi:hypothetical protein